MTPAKFLRKDKLGDSLYTFWFAPEKQLDFIAGQFAEISLPHSQADDRGERRWFSLSSDPNDSAFSITTRITESNTSSFKRHLLSLSAKDTVRVADVMGDFVLPKKITTPIVWIAAGVGIAPFISMAMANKQNPQNCQIDLFWTTSYDELLPHQTLFAASAKSVNVYEKGSSLTVKDIIEKVSTETSEDGLFYIAGPEKFVESLQSKLLENDISANRIIADYFDGY